MLYQTFMILYYAQVFVVNILGYHESLFFLPNFYEYYESYAKFPSAKPLRWSSMKVFMSTKVFLKCFLC
jgi:hypothetical protein